MLHWAAGHTDSNETKNLAKNRCIMRVLLDAGANASAIWERKDFSRVPMRPDMTDVDFTLQLIRSAYIDQALELGATAEPENSLSRELALLPAESRTIAWALDSSPLIAWAVPCARSSSKPEHSALIRQLQPHCRW